MKFYSEKTGNLYNNINELKAAENAFEEEQNKKQNEQRAKDEERIRLKNKIKELENQKISIKVGFEKIFETKMDNAKIIDTLRELLRGE